MAAIAAAVDPARIVLPLGDAWYRADDLMAGQRQFVFRDPDGHLLRPFQPLGTRPADQRPA